MRWYTMVLCLLPAGLYPLSGLAPAGVPLMLSLMLFLNLWALALYDFASFRLPNLLTATLVFSGLLHIWLMPVDVLAHLVGGFVGLVFFPLVNAVYRRVRGRDGIGLGDAKLLAGIGLWLAWQALPPVLLVASLGGLLFGLAAGVRGGASLMTARIPFGPFLCLGAWVVWLFFRPYAA